jgi:hypothetical protein
MSKMISILWPILWPILWAIVLTIGTWQVTPPALAAPICRTIQDHDICLLTIKRSAKNFWEYNAAVSIDGKRGPKESYNCRSRYKTLRNGSIEYFAKDSIGGSLVCKIYKPTRKGMPETLTME